MCPSELHLQLLRLLRRLHLLHLLWRQLGRMAFLSDGGPLARLSHSIQKELKVGDTVVVVASAHDEHLGARGVVKQVNSVAAASGQLAYQVEILTEHKQPSEHKQPVRWWFSRLQLSPAPKGGSPEKSRGRLPSAAEDSQTSPRADNDPETITDNGKTTTFQEDNLPKAAHLALAAERERAEELALKQKMIALKQRSSTPSAARKAPPSIPSRSQSAKSGPRSHSAKGAQNVKGPQSTKGVRSVGTERSASPPRRVPGSAPFVLCRPSSPQGADWGRALGADAACEECVPLPQPDYMHEPDSAAGAAASPPRQDSALSGASPSASRLVARHEGSPRGGGAPLRRRVAADQQGWREASEQHETRVQTFRRWVSDEHAPPSAAEAKHTTCHSAHLPHTAPAPPAPAPPLPGEREHEPPRGRRGRRGLRATRRGHWCVDLLPQHRPDGQRLRAGATLRRGAAVQAVWRLGAARQVVGRAVRGAPWAGGAVALGR